MLVDRAMRCVWFRWPIQRMLAVKVVLLVSRRTWRHPILTLYLSSSSVMTALWKLAAEIVWRSRLSYLCIVAQRKTVAGIPSFQMTFAYISHLASFV
jgi:hypothetical protein